MTTDVSGELRALAAMITSAYAGAHPMRVDTLSEVLRQAYLGLDACAHPPAPPPAPLTKARRRARRH